MRTRKKRMPEENDDPNAPAWLEIKQLPEPVEKRLERRLQEKRLLSFHVRLDLVDHVFWRTTRGAAKRFLKGLAVSDALSFHLYTKDDLGNYMRVSIERLLELESTPRPTR